jgi:hypothetical protein
MDMNCVISNTVKDNISNLTVPNVNVSIHNLVWINIIVGIDFKLWIWRERGFRRIF